MLMRVMRYVPAMIFRLGTVGVSLTVIGFWYKRPHRHFCHPQAFRAIRGWDFGFVLARRVAAATPLLGLCTVFRLPTKSLPRKFNHRTTAWSAITFTCICCSSCHGSRAVPFNIWLPTRWRARRRISALIHAATMVPAGIFHGAPYVTAVRSVETSVIRW